MAEGFLKSFDTDLEVYSAGTQPSGEVHPKAIQVMKEKGIDISNGYPKKVDRFLNEAFDYVITVCDDARETCPVFLGEVKERLHLGFEDPAKATGTAAEILNEFRRIRDLIESAFYDLYKNKISREGK